MITWWELQVRKWQNIFKDYNSVDITQTSDKIEMSSYKGYIDQLLKSHP